MWCVQSRVYESSSIGSGDRIAHCELSPGADDSLALQRNTSIWMRCVQSRVYDPGSIESGDCIVHYEHSPGADGSLAL